MGEKLIVGPIDKGLRTDRTAFIIDNDSFPTLINAYQWRGRVKRKRGTSLLTRLQRNLTNFTEPNPDGSPVYSNDLLLSLRPTQAGAQVVPGSLTFALDFGLGNETIYNDDGFGNVTLTSGVFTISSGTINYNSGVLTLNFTGIPGPGIPAQATLNYHPNLPVLGLEDFVFNSNQFPGTIGFDTTYSYNILTTGVNTAYDVSYYKNPPSNTYPSYVQKTNVTPTSWNGLDYQQFWTVNYQGAMWATNGMQVPFVASNISMQFASPTTNPALTLATWVNATTMTFTIPGNPLVVGDFVFVNEFVGGSGLNFQTGYVTAPGSTFTVVFPNAKIANATYTSGMVQYLTNRSDTTKDCLRWYDGDPTNGNATSPTLNGMLGWVNFAPPLSQLSYSVSDVSALQYYLVGAKMIIPFKDRLLFLGPVIQTSTPNSQIYLQDTVIYSQNGTAYYTASYFNTPTATTDTPTSVTNTFNPVLVPANQSATPTAYFEDSTGFGGFATAGIDQPITSVGPNEDVLIVGFTTFQSRLIYTGNDIIPFNFFTINAEQGTGSTFSAIIMSKGIISRGNRGFIITSQVGVQRIDLSIPDQVFEINLTSNGTERMCAQRDFINEWIYFTYPSNDVTYNFPNQTLQFNYADETYAIFNECYTTYGTFRIVTGQTWATIGKKYATWGQWNEPWGSGASTLLQPKVIGGNQQGFVLLRDVGTSEGNSLYIQNIVASVITSPNHCLNNGDYIIISGALGTIGPLVNGNIFSVSNATNNTFTLNPLIGTGTYLGAGVIQRMYVPFVQTKQFPNSWNLARKTRLGPQQYLFTKTGNGQIQLLIFLSQDDENPYNTGTITPSPIVDNSSLIYSTTLFTCPESTNLGLTAANVNLNMPTASSQVQIWHRMNTSLIGDTVQIGFTLSDTQMRDTTLSNQFAEIELHSFILDLSPSQMLS